MFFINHAMGGNSLIIKNSLYLYLRMFIGLLVSLYTSRIVLETLGVEDYGIYNLTGGIVGIFCFLNDSMASASSRFLTYELGKNGDVNKTFSKSLTIHVIVAFIVLILSETVGLYYVCKVMVVPEGKFSAAFWVYQISILTTFVGIIVTVYDSLLIAYEKMQAYSYFGLMDIGCKLLVIYALMVLPGNSLIIYALLLMGMSYIRNGLMVVYCKRKIGNCDFKLSSFRSGLKPMLSFFGWNLYGDLGGLARTQGLNILLNGFFGVVVNAAYAVANQVTNTIYAFSGTVFTAIRPQIIKAYASGDKYRMYYLILKSSVFTSLLFLIFIIPLMLETPFILSIWLVEVPEYSAVFCRLGLFFLFFMNLSRIIVTGCHATGAVKIPNIINGTIYFLMVPIVYILYRYNYPPQAAYIYNAFGALACFLSHIYCLKLSYVEFPAFKYLSYTSIRILLPGAIMLLFIRDVSGYLEEGWLRLGCVLFLTLIIIGLYTLYVVMSAHERSWVINKVRLLSWRKA